VTRRIAVLVAVGLLPNACAGVEGSGSLPASNASVASSINRTAGLKTIFTFNGSDGAAPYGALIALDGVLYGTTEGGGANNAGTAFSLTSNGSEKVLHSFGSDGSYPKGPLLALNGVFYGATQSGGKSSDGTIFALRTNGKPLWSYDFKGGWDGGNPNGGLTALGAALYGTSYGGGNPYENAGSFFKVTSSRNETVLRDFSGGADGGNPNGSLVLLHGAFYGTTHLGGIPYAQGGAVVRLTSTGGETVLHRFGKSNDDGTLPEAGLLYYNGAFYGTTQTGGEYGLGTIFSITPTGKESVIHSFGAPGDGTFPECPLLVYDGNFYGTTPDGGKNGWGTVFEVGPSGKERVLYDFTDTSDGGKPGSGLVALNGVLYGTTSGNLTTEPYGTVFALTP